MSKDTILELLDIIKNDIKYMDESNEVPSPDGIKAMLLLLSKIRVYIEKE